MASLVRFVSHKRLQSIHSVMISLYRDTVFDHSLSSRGSLVCFCCSIQAMPRLLYLQRTISFKCFFTHVACAHQRSYGATSCSLESLCMSTLFSSLCSKNTNLHEIHNALLKWQQVKYMSNVPVMLKTDNDMVRFCLDKLPPDKNGSQIKGKKMPKRVKMSKKAKLNELRFYRLKAKKKIRSPNPEVRIRYKLEKAKRKELWLIEKLRKFEVPKAPAETYDPESLTEEERFYLKRTGEKKKNYVIVGRRGVFGGVVLNMHLHWKKHETVKVVCKPCKPGQVYEYAEELAQLSKGIVIDIKANNTIIFYCGKNYVQPQVMSPPDTLSKNKALEKYRYEQSLEHTSQFIEKLEKELEEYHKHLARYRKGKETASDDSTSNI
ncbi:PREDICTED: uncharacterized CRM domain-containing protein At3g25440, chloroplastic-like [Nelumbo nucifera]|uniref:Uncharacterized CRM domain-containing protein At3g25440, chloroplastic-like n=2 Tax=Nelumbo nucifera TaxID=4432 RepID=A0A1U7ZSW7_NELNU|nr:PREDICTED: uncharacterized CRM domain-containing protein At3g25440, chloroplastic-like [Nelumbo nucifera]XP_010257415.1 PREDICTED: uncharacterized CRM domain-containing protein At3g25440, chloroplastic-like [Nelumbo nucifera]DAD34876.1 TPA_asm: hypothetical protein HUJ06_005516 [Nelumbo nucifera]